MQPPSLMRQPRLFLYSRRVSRALTAMGFGECSRISSSLLLLNPDVVPSRASTAQVPRGHRGATTALRLGATGRRMLAAGWARHGALAWQAGAFRQS